MILFLFGEDTFRSHQKLLQLKGQFFAKYKESSERYEFDMDEDVAFEDVANALQGGGLFATKKLVVLKRVFESSKSEQERLVEYIKSIEGLDSDPDTVVLFWDAKADKRSKLFLYLKKNAKQLDELKYLQGAQLDAWIKTQLRSQGSELRIDNNALRSIVQKIGADSGRISMELEKLAVYVISQGKDVVQLDDVELLVSGEMQGIIFEALDALGSGDKRRAFTLLHDQLEKGENPIYLFTMYTYQIRNLLMVTSYYEDGLRDPRGIASQAKMAPFVVQKLLSQTKNFSVSRLKKDLQQLARFDIAMKTGRIEPELALEEFILKS